MSFMKASGRDHTSATDHEAAIEEVMKTARAYDKTFWKHLAELKAYHDEFPDDVVKIDDKKILTMKSGRSQEHDTLKRWMEVMIGCAQKKGNEENYGLKAYEKIRHDMERRMKTSKVDDEDNMGFTPSFSS